MLIWKKVWQIFKHKIKTNKKYFPRLTSWKSHWLRAARKVQHQPSRSCFQSFLNFSPMSRSVDEISMLSFNSKLLSSLVAWVVALVWSNLCLYCQNSSAKVALFKKVHSFCFFNHFFQNMLCQIDRTFGEICFAKLRNSGNWVASDCMEVKWSLAMCSLQSNL